MSGSLDWPAVDDVVAERNRQVSQEGWSAAHDDEHSTGEMACAAAAYAWLASISDQEAAHLAASLQEHGHGVGIGDRAAQLWPWDPAWLKPAGKRRNLVKAAALIIAEIDRLDRKAAADLGDVNGRLA